MSALYPDSDDVQRKKLLAQHIASISDDFDLSKEDKTIIASVCSTWADPEAVLDAAAGPKKPLGQILATSGKINHRDLNEILAAQAVSGHRLGEMVVAKGLASTNDIDRLLDLQQRLASTPKEDRPERLGNLLLRTGDISAEQLDVALQDRRKSQQRIGEVLVARGYATPGQIARGLKLQSALSALAFLAAVVLWAPKPADAASSFDSETGKSTASAALDIGVRIPSFLRVTKLDHPSTLTIEAKDIALGYINLPAESEIAVTTNSRSGFLVNFQGRFDMIRKIRVEGMAQAVEIDAESSGASVQILSGKTEAKYGLSYRFTLAANARPGVYPWPVTISASSPG